MAQIGNLGSLIVFEVSSEKVLTFGRVNRTVKGRWATHAVIGGKPISEFLGPDLGTITFPIFLTVNHGVKPRKVMENIEKAVEKGTPFPFVLGGKKVGTHQWKITQMSEAWGEIIKDGRIVSANLTLTLEEYV